MLWVDLSKKELKDEALDEKLGRDFLGGYGLGARILFSRQKAGVDPLGPEAILGLTTGVLTGTDALGRPVSDSATVDVDRFAPVITLSGASFVVLTAGEAWSDPGATATDDVDGSVPVVVSRVASLGFEVRVEARAVDGTEVWAQLTRGQSDELDLRSGGTVHIGVTEVARTPVLS